ncbi:SMR family transporter [Rhodopirellula sp. SWK7]
MPNLKSLFAAAAYTLWVGIGTLGAVLLGMVSLDEPLNLGRTFFLTLLAF